MAAAQIRVRYTIRKMEDEQLLSLVHPKGLSIMMATMENFERMSIDELAHRVRDFEWVIDILDMIPNTAQLSESRANYEMAMQRIRGEVGRMR